MADIVELERRVTALEAKTNRTEEEVSTIRRDIRKLAAGVDYAIEQIEALNRRMAVFELETKEALIQIRGDVDHLKSGVAQVKAEQAAFRREFPGIVADVVREALREQRA
jgi:hypothetical protein